jgi:thioredoxin 1
MIHHSASAKARIARRKTCRNVAAAVALAALLTPLAPATAAAAPAAAVTAAATQTGQHRVVGVSGFTFGSKVLAAQTPVLVDFSASWCVPCQAIARNLDAVAAAYGDRVRIVRVNVTWSPMLARRYDVRALPTLLLFDHGVLVERVTGALGVDDIRDLLASSVHLDLPATAAVQTAQLAGHAATAVDR